MRVEIFACIVTCAVFLAGAQPTHATVFEPKLIQNLGTSERLVLRIGKKYEFNDIHIPVCTRKNDFQNFIALEKSGADSVAFLKETEGCGFLVLPTAEIVLSEKLGEFENHDGVRFWYIQIQNENATMTMYIALPTQTFDLQD